MVDNQFCKLGEVRAYLINSGLVTSITKQCISDYVERYENIKYSKMKVATSWTEEDRQARYDQCFQWVMYL